jgi:hypothetical protein
MLAEWMDVKTARWLIRDSSHDAARIVGIEVKKYHSNHLEICSSPDNRVIFRHQIRKTHAWRAPLRNADFCRH